MNSGGGTNSLLNKKGFSLIELLATIVILAIILLIAVPIVLNIIESVRISAFKSSATNIGRSAQLTYSSEMIKKQDSGRLEFYYEKEEGVIKEKSNKVGVFLNYSGERPDGGIVVVNKQGKVDLVLYNEKYKLCAIKKYEENKVKVEKNISEKDCVDKISRPTIEIIGENPLILEYEKDGIYNLGEGDYIAYTSEGEETNNVKIYVDGIESNQISRGIIKKEYEVIYRVIEGEMFQETERIIKIMDTIPPVITSVVSGVSSITKTNFTITRSGDASDAHSGLAANPYIFQTSLDGSVWTTKCINNTTSCTVSGLSEGTTYYYRICVNDILENQSCVASKTVQTLLGEYNPTQKVNRPVLATGMTPIKWNGSSWVNTTINDTDWYDYGTSTKKWANARTADGSMWVWIPRYAYQIATCYHTSCSGGAGTINIKFLQGKTNTAADGTTVATTPTYSGNSQTNYIKHPAFTFGNDEILGFWVAKFEMTGSESAIESKPNVTSLRNIVPSNMFAYSRNMETNNRYGWGTTGVGIDTHMIKNTEWGAVAYLSQSTYGKNAEVWPNAYVEYVTGCSGSGVNAAGESPCIQYHTTNGQQASTTGTIYGVYDMSGGAWECVAGIYGNGSDKYYNYYSGYTSSIFGDAVYETSISSSDALSWYRDYSSMPSSTYPWVIRGGLIWNPGPITGVFSFNKTRGAYVHNSWRVVVLVGDGL